MHESLISYIKRYSPLPISETEIETIKEVFVPKKIRKRQYFLQEGQVCRQAAFIVKGAMRQYTVDEKGAEHIVRLFIEDWWVNDRESYVKLTPSIYNIDAWEDCELLLVTRAEFLSRLDSMPATNDAIKKMYDNFAAATLKRLSSISQSAEERYVELARTRPQFLQRFPQHIIASYLGITKETLSRIRSQAAKK